MARIMVEAWKCDICEHVWICQPGPVPKQCAKCRTRIWNCDGATVETKPTKVETIAAKVETRPVAVVEVVEAKTEVIQQQCRYTEYDQETGETYGCNLALGHKFKHQRGRKL